MIGLGSSIPAAASIDGTLALLQLLASPTASAKVLQELKVLRDDADTKLIDITRREDELAKQNAAVLKAVAEMQATAKDIMDRAVDVAAKEQAAHEASTRLDAISLSLETQTKELTAREQEVLRREKEASRREKDATTRGREYEAAWEKLQKILKPGA